MLNPFSNDAFNMVALTAAINKIPNNYGRLEQLNLMPVEGVRTRTILIEEMSAPCVFPECRANPGLPQASSAASSARRSSPR